MDKRLYKNDFIQAYMYLYGSTKTAAAAAYKAAPAGYVVEIVKSMKQDAKSTFYND